MLRTLARANVSSSLVASSRHGSPRCGAVLGGLLARERQQWPHEDSVPRLHAQQGAAARRRRQPVEDRLDLVGRGVAGRDVAAARERQLGGGAVALVARPRLQIADLRSPRAPDLEPHPEPFAQLAAVQLVRVGAVAQAVVHVQRVDPLGARDPHGEIEQAGRVAPSGEQNDHFSARRKETGVADGLEHQSSSRCLAMKISVVSVNPFSRTSAIRSNSRCDPPCSTTGRVTRTSPPAERAETREAMFTSRP